MGCGLSARLHNRWTARPRRVRGCIGMNAAHHGGNAAQEGESCGTEGGRGARERTARRPGELRWTIDPALSSGDPLRGPLESALRRWADLPEDPAAQVIKSNRLRTVVRYDPGLAPPRWILKQYRHPGWLDRLRFRFIPSHAEREWQALRRLRELGFDAPRPLAFGIRRSEGLTAEGGLVMEEVSGAAALREALAAALPGGTEGALSPEGEGLIARTGVLLRALHDAGADLPDLHASNFLLTPGGVGCGTIHIIDLHSARFRRLSARRRLSRLARMVHSLLDVMPRAGIAPFLAAYQGEHRAVHGDSGGLVHLLEAQAARLSGVRLRSRSRRCLTESTGFAVERSAGARIYRRREVPRADLDRVLRGGPPADLLKSDAKGWVGRVGGEGQAGAVGVPRGAVGGGGGGSDHPVAYFVKRRRYSLLESLRGLVEGHRLRRAYFAGFSFEVRGIPTPRVLALIEERRFGFVRGAFLLTEFVAEGESLDRYLMAEFFERSRPCARRKRLLARSAGSLLRQVHDAGIYTQDFSPQNILVSPAALREAEGSGSGAAVLSSKVVPSAVLPPGVLLLADLDSVHFWRRLTPARRRRNLVQAGNLPEGHIFWSDRLRALHAYARGERGFLDPEFVSDLREGLLQEAELTLNRDVGGWRNRWRRWKARRSSPR